MNKRFYIRFGEIPDKERSKIHRGNEVIGEENGVSVYDTVFYDDEWKIIYPNPSTEHTCFDLNDFISDIGLNTSCKREAYLVTGDKIGIGRDGEPLIINVRIIMDITHQFRYSETASFKNDTVLVTKEVVEN